MFTPFSLVDEYHSLRISDSRMGLSFTANIWMYVSGGNSWLSNEYNDVMSRIAVKLKLRGPSLVPNTFYIPDDSRVDPSEPFFKQGMRRAYAGRGSPEEIADAVRLAWLTKRCKPYVENDPKKYAEGVFGQDCNAFAGNYLGISPNCSISSYVNGYGDKIPGGTNCVYHSSAYLPLPVVTNVNQITVGTIIITYDRGSGKQFRHIALVESFHLLHGGTKALISVAEWGTAGKTAGSHAKAPVEITLRFDKTAIVRQRETKVIGWVNNDGNLRYFVDATPLDNIDSRGWHICGTEGL